MSVLAFSSMNRALIAADDRCHTTCRMLLMPLHIAIQQASKNTMLQQETCMMQAMQTCSRQEERPLRFRSCITAAGRQVNEVQRRQRLQEIDQLDRSLNRGRAVCRVLVAGNVSFAACLQRCALFLLLACLGLSFFSAAVCCVLCSHASRLRLCCATRCERAGVAGGACYCCGACLCRACTCTCTLGRGRECSV